MNFHDDFLGDFEPLDEDDPDVVQFRSNLNWLDMLETPATQFVFFDSGPDFGLGGRAQYKRLENLEAAAGQLGIILHDSDDDFPTFRFSPTEFTDASIQAQPEHGRQRMEWLTRELVTRICKLRDLYEKTSAKSPTLQSKDAYLPGALYVLRVLDHEAISDVVLQHIVTACAVIHKEAANYSDLTDVPSERVREAIVLKVQELMQGFDDIRPLRINDDLTVSRSPITLASVTYDAKAFSAALFSMSSAAGSLGDIAKKLLQWRAQRPKKSKDVPDSQAASVPPPEHAISGADERTEEHDRPFKVIGTENALTDPNVLHEDVRGLIARVARMRAAFGGERGTSADPYSDGGAFARSVLESSSDDMLRQVRASATIAQLDAEFYARRAAIIARDIPPADRTVTVHTLSVSDEGVAASESRGTVLTFDPAPDCAVIAARVHRLLNEKANLPSAGGVSDELAVTPEQVGLHPRAFSRSIFRFSLAAKAVWKAADTLLAERAQGTPDQAALAENADIRKDQLRNHWNPDGAYVCAEVGDDVAVSFGSDPLVTFKGAAPYQAELQTAINILQELDWNDLSRLEWWHGMFPEIYRAFFQLIGRTIPRLLRAQDLQEDPERIELAKLIADFFIRGNASIILRNLSDSAFGRGEAMSHGTEFQDIDALSDTYSKQYLLAAELLGDAVAEVAARNDGTDARKFATETLKIFSSDDQKAYTNFVDNMRVFAAGLLEQKLSGPLHERVRGFMQQLPVSP